MAQFKDLHCYPYSGWPDVPWGLARPLEAAPTEDELDIDAAARSSRRVTESVSAELPARGLTAGFSSHRIRISIGNEQEVVVGTFRRRTYDFGHLSVPHGFRFLTPADRAEVLAESVEQHLFALAEVWDWDPRLVRDATRAARENNWSAAYCGPWKHSRDRKRRARLFGRIHDDGYARWQIGIAEIEQDAHVLESKPVLGWTWIANMRTSATRARFIDGDHLEVPPGSRFLSRTHVVSLASAAVEGGTGEEEVLTYPGDRRAASSRPHVQVIAH